MSDSNLTRRQLLAGLAATAAAPGMLAGMTAPPNRRPNVLFIAVDDLSPRLGGYGDAHAKTPNIDRLIARGTAFTRAYCQMAVCGPSRASQLTGCRPDATGVNQNHEYNDGFVDDFTASHPTAPTWFAKHGYHVRLGGKLHHQAQEKIECVTGEPIPGKRGHFTDYVTEENLRNFNDTPRRPLFESPDVPDEAYKDGTLAANAVAAMKQHVESGDDRPLFLGVGFAKPHLPYTAPKRYWDLYDRDAIPLAAAPDKPANVPGWTTASYELAGQYEHAYTKESPVTDDVARRLRHGYYACTSYTDACVGKLLDALDETGLAENTLVVFWVDHGFHLGDNGMWGKHVNYEVGTRVPLVFAGPNVPAGRKIDRVTEMLDVYPTLCSLAGMERPEHLEGSSLAAIIEGRAAWANEGAAAFSQYPRASAVGRCVRTPRWRYVEWRNRASAMDAVGQAENTVRLRELYDHDADPHETTNVAADHPEAVAELAALLVPVFGENAGEGEA